MKGGFNNPPNHERRADALSDLRASMKGGFNNPPNVVWVLAVPGERAASMKGGFNNPPNPPDALSRARLSRLQ